MSPHNTQRTYFRVLRKRPSGLGPSDGFRARGKPTLSFFILYIKQLFVKTHEEVVERRRMISREEPAREGPGGPRTARGRGHT
jgi:hypothetical protein